MTRTLVVGPFNRVEGDLEIRLDVSDGVVQAAYANSPLFRGFEMMLTGKDPRDALTITPRICGICSISQSFAAARALASAQGIAMAPAGERVAQLIHAIENVSDHITHFNLFFMPDFARPLYRDRSWHETVSTRFLATKGGAARSSVEARARLMHILGLLAGKWPHTLAIQPGGVTKAPSLSDKMRIQATLGQFRRYLEDTLFGSPLDSFVSLTSQDDLMGWTTGDVGIFLRVAADLDLASLGRGSGRYLSFGAYEMEQRHVFARGVWDGAPKLLDTDLIAEDVSHAWMTGGTTHPTQGMTVPDEDMNDPAYSWCKAPRLGGAIAETGALARQVVDGHPLARDLARNQAGVLSRIAGRLLEIARLQLLMEQWAAEIQPDSRFLDSHAMPRSGQGEGLVEAARGALGHWVEIERGLIARYQIIAPTTWNFSPRDIDGAPGPVEAALVGAAVQPDEQTPITVQHIVRSFDPCMVCTVH